MTDSAASLVVGCCEASAPRIRAVLDGTFPIPGFNTRFAKLAPGEMLIRPFLDEELAVAELSLSTYVTRVARSDCPYVALPVYTARAFPHSWFHARADRGISNLADLRGRRVGISAYQRTMNVWARGFLADECGMDPRDMHWAVRDSPEAAQAFRPKGVPVEILHTDKTLSALLEEGELDAMVSMHPPECFTRGASSVKRVVQGDLEAARDYFRRTGVFPILHIMGLRRELLHKRPDLAGQLFEAFAAAKGAFDAAKGGETGSWQDNAYAYGVGAVERSTLEFFLKHHFSQGLSERQLDVEDLFEPVTLSQYQKLTERS